jgi:hypothetical protein
MDDRFMTAQVIIPELLDADSTPNDNRTYDNYANILPSLPKSDARPSRFRITRIPRQNSVTGDQNFTMNPPRRALSTFGEPMTLPAGSRFRIFRIAKSNPVITPESTDPQGSVDLDDELLRF